MNAENAVELFEACKGKTRRQVEEHLAARFPRPEVREQIRRLPARPPIPAERGQPISPLARAVGVPVSRAVGAETPSIAHNSGPLAVAATASDSRRRAREIEPLSTDRFGVHFTADAELRELIERARALASHRLPKGDLAGLMKLMAASFVQQEEKRRFGVGARPRRAPAQTKPASSAEQATPPGGATGLSPKTTEHSPQATKSSAAESRAVPVGKRNRYLPVAVRRDAHGRDRGQCAYVSAEGRRCQAQTLLEFDHIKPFARFGAPDTRNIRLLCRAHNLLHARNCFGAMHLAAKIAARNRPAL